MPKAFQYPEHPEWSIDSNDEEDLIEMGKSIKNIWWLIRVMGFVWKPARDILLGYVWEEDDQSVGLCNVLRQGGSQQWMIGNVAVLPEYRRRGIARKLVQACVDLAIERGAEQIMLDVVDGNVPAYELYKNMGFNHYAGQFIYEHKDETANLPTTPIPTPYITRLAKFQDWPLRYALMKRIMPPHVQEYEPVTEDKYKVPLVVRIFRPIIMRSMRMQTKRILVNDAQGQVVGLASYQVRKTGKGAQQLTLTLDKEHAIVSQPILEQFLHEIRQIAPTATIELHLPDWQFCEEEIDPRLVGFEQRLIYHRLGMQV